MLYQKQNVSIANSKGLVQQCIESSTMTYLTHSYVKKREKLAVIVLIEIILENMRKIVKDGEMLIRTPKQLSFKYFDIFCFVGKFVFFNFNFEITKPYVAGGQFGQYKMMQKTLKNAWNPCI